MPNKPLFSFLFLIFFLLSLEQVIMQTTNQFQLFPATPQRTVRAEDRESVVIDNDDILAHNEEVNSGFVNNFDDFIHNGMVKIQEASHDYRVMEKVFLSGMGRTTTHATNDPPKIVAMHKNMVSDPIMNARWLSFQIYTKSVKEKSGNNNANVQFAWYGGSREELSEILSHGFCQSRGVGIHLSHANFPIDCVESSVVDADGLRHMLLCRVILGKLEEIPACSKQFKPSSPQFVSGVDSLQKPRRYIVWNALTNSHIFPTYIISFKAPTFNGIKRNQVRKLWPTSPWLSFPTLLHILSKCLEPSKMTWLYKFRDDYKKNKISRQQLIQKIRLISGDRLLIEMIDKHKNKLMISPSGRGTKDAAASV